MSARVSPIRHETPQPATQPRPPDTALRTFTSLAMAHADAPATRTRLQELDRPPWAVRWGPQDDALRTWGAQVRRETLANLEGHLEHFAAAVRSRGGHVHHAKDAADACRIIGDLAAQRGVRTAVKSKSMVTEEIGLNDALAARGVRVVETDLGEYIVQLRGERPSQLITPALHLDQRQVASTFAPLGCDPGADPEALGAFARAQLRQEFARAEMGITGVNFAAADTGTLVIVSNEGNIDQVTAHPEVHVAVLGMEKVVARLADIPGLVRLLCRAAGDDVVTCCQSFLTGPRTADEPDGPSELHVVIVDNGRSRMLGTPFEEALACIRCGNCQMMCPVFKAVAGGHAYPSTYGGPIGAVISPFLGDPEADTDLPFLSTLCGACADACPVRIPLPDLLVEGRVRAQQRATGPAHAVERAGWRAWAAAWSHPTSYRASVAGARLAGYLPQRLLASLPMAKQWATGRDLPPLRRAGAFRKEARHD